MAYENGNARLIRGIPVSNTLPINGQAPVYSSATGEYVPALVADSQIIWLGAWSAVTAYNQYDAVEYNGSSYIANTGNTNKTPGVDPEWDLWVEAGTDGAAGAAGPMRGVYARFNYDSSTVDADPGLGKFRLNNANLNNVTEIYIDVSDLDSNLINGWASTWDSSTSAIKGVLSFYNVAQAQTFSYNISSLTFPTGYIKIVVTFDNAFIVPNNGEEHYISFVSNGDKGDTGATGSQGLIWQGAWLTATAYALQDAIEEAGSSYICIEAHTSGTFATDLAAGKWELLAQKGADGAGTGDVVGPASATDNAIARFDSTTGKLIQNSTATLDDAGLLSTDSVTLATRLNAPEIKATGAAGLDIHNNTGTQVALFGAGGSTGTSLVGTTNIGSSSADYLQVSGGTGSASITATGSSADININLVPKGAGLSILGNASATSLAVTGTAGAGYITLVGQASNPSAPAAGTLLLHSSTANGFTRLEQDNEAATNLIYGRDNAFIAKNTSGSTINKGQVVYVTGSTGNVPNISLAQANSGTTIPTIAVAVDNISNNAFGQIMYAGIISGIDTSAFTTGASLYVSPTVAGGLTATRPSGTTNYVQRVGTVLVSGVGNGSIQVLIAPAVLNMETGTNASTWTGTNIVANGSVTTGLAGSATGSVLFKGTTSGTVTLSTADAAGTWTMKLPTTAGTSGYFLQTDGSGNTTWAAAGGGLSWNTSVNGATGTGLALAMDNSYAASGIGQSITIGDTQTNALTAFKIDVGSSLIDHTGISVISKWSGNDSASSTSGGIIVNTFSSATQALSTSNYVNSVVIGNNFNTSSSNYHIGLFAINENNAGGGYNTAIRVYNKSTSWLTNGAGAGLALFQNGVGGTALTVVTSNNINSSTNGLVNYTLSNTQSGATVMQKIDTGTSAQGHTGLLVNMFNASTSAKALSIDFSTTGTGTGLYFNATDIHSGSSFITFNLQATGNLTAFGGTFMKTNGEQALYYNDNTQKIYLYTQQYGNNTSVLSRTNPLYQFDHLFRYQAASGTGTVSSDMFYVVRRNRSVTAGGTLSASGSTLKVENSLTAGSGTVTDTVTPLLVVQNSGSTGSPIAITQNAVVSTNYRKLITETVTGITIWMGNGTTANGTLSGTAGDILINGGSNKPEYCTGTTNWTALV